MKLLPLPALSAAITLSLLLIAGFSQPVTAVERNEPNPASSIVFTDLQRSKTLSLAEMLKGVKHQTIEVYEPVYKNTRKYKAFKFNDIAALAGFNPAKASNITFQALDGYNSVLSPALRDKFPALWLAYQDLSSKDGNVFELVREGKKMMNPGPFYLISEDPASYKVWPWPFAVNKIIFQTQNDPYASIAPAKSANAHVTEGFDLFKHKCLACHSVNLVGGTIGPELNIPKNITEYRSDAFLKAWIKDPGSFRARSRMAGVSEISDAQIDRVLDYLRYMKNHKIPVPEDH